MPPHDTIRRHANGAIDLEHYTRIGRKLHARAVRRAGRRISSRIRARGILNLLLLLLVK